MISDEAVLAAVGDGLRTWAIAKKLGVSAQAARRRLNNLAARGLVRRSARYSYVNDIYWEPVTAEVSA